MVCRGRFLIRDREPTVQNVPHNNGKAGLWGISTPASTQPPGGIGAAWSDTLSRHKRPNQLKSIWQIVNSLLPFCGLWYLMYLSVSWSYWVTLVLAVPTAGFLIRLFIIQHDCGHHSFLRSRRANDLVGSFCGVLTLTPYYL